jgi:hypothetical protein
MVHSRIHQSSAFSLKKIIPKAMLAASAVGVISLIGCLETSAPSTEGGRPRANQLATSMAMAPMRLEAEKAKLTGAVVKSDKAGFSGTGYADYQANSGEKIDWTANIPSTGSYKLTFRYANGGTVSRPLSIANGGTVVNGKLAFPPTGSWTTWKTVTINTNLSSGARHIFAASTGLSGPNMDYLEIASGTTTTPPPPTGTRKSVLTWFTSYPDPGSDECLHYNGCTWAGQFAALDGKQSESWVKSHNIIAVHEKDFSKYRLKTFHITQGTHAIDAVVYDECADSDCNGCCTKNAGSTGFLIDMESFTADRFGANDGIVNWVCTNCN